jgi:drug/metabolite transporter (DMT)-like permease
LPAEGFHLRRRIETLLEIILGIAAALGWGVADFSARFATRRIGAYRTLMLMQLFGFLALTIYLARTGLLSRHLASGWHPWAFAVLAGLMNTGSSLALYRSFEVGAISIAGPVSSAYPALTVALALASGERINLQRGAGMAITFVGLILAAISFMPDAPQNADPDPGANADAGGTHLSKGAGWAIIAAVGYGVMFWWLGFHVVPLVGSAASVWVVRMSTFAALALAGIPSGHSLRLPRGSVWWLLAVVGLMDTAAFVANNAGMETGHVAVISVLSSLYGAVTVLLSWIFLRERIEPSQWLGILLIFVGIVFVSL